MLNNQQKYFKLGVLTKDDEMSANLSQTTKSSFKRLVLLWETVHNKKDIGFYVREDQRNQKIVTIKKREPQNAKIQFTMNK